MTSPAQPGRDGAFYAFNAALTLAVLGLLAWILLARGGGGVDAELGFLPAVNAGLNALTTALLLAGYAAIRRGRRDLHRLLMVSALACAALFLVCYVLYHYAHGDTRYPGEGALRALYFAVLITHVLCSMLAVPLVLSTAFFALRGRFATHRKVARLTLPLWLYVSVTGVVIFFMLRAAGA